MVQQTELCRGQGSQLGARPKVGPAPAPLDPRLGTQAWSGGVGVTQLKQVKSVRRQGGHIPPEIGGAKHKKP